MQFLCGRPGCGEESTATLQIDALAESVSLVDPRVSRDGVPLCARHADSTTPPMGWSMNDLRSTPGALGQSDGALVDAKPPRVRPAGGEDRPSDPDVGSRFDAIFDDDDDESFDGFDTDTDTGDDTAAAADGDETETVGGDAEVIDLNSVPARRARRGAGQEGPATRPTRRRDPAAETASDEAEPSHRDQFPWHYEFDEEDQPEGLRASSPLLSRAFRST